ncbi:hypothetical protein LFM56_04095 [Cellulomonas iranensis]|uniref:hypothetical protein n=1 Tax=Cellulomonas iranensis TaxID=76862 RepID=UPI001CF2A573|nr:hypothetical protein [Cellulomonas iranensis]UCN15515.1 hypothetical protein LFM56_04095 [Cellulomonas iranensis]
MTAGLVAPTAGDVGPAAAAGVVVALAVLLGALPWRVARAPRAPGAGGTGDAPAPGTGRGAGALVRGVAGRVAVPAFLCTI